MNILLSALINHFLSVAEQELIKSEPEIVQSIENELKLLISKIENLLSKKSPGLAELINPGLITAESLVEKVINTAGNATISK